MAPFTILVLYCIINTMITTIPTFSISDRVALLSIKSKIMQDPQGVLNSWNDSVHFCLWEGVICSRHHNNRVTGLSLQTKGLVGTLSPFVGNLSFLQNLTLSNNTFTGYIPPQLGHLQRLQTLGLSTNSFEGEIPGNIFNCSSLTNLILDHNKLVGKIPPELGLLSNLQELGLDYNNLTGGLLSIANLTRLQSLFLSGQGFLGTGIGFQAPVPDFIGKFRDLSVLALGGSNFIGTIPPSIYNLSSMQVFSLDSNQLWGNLPPNLGFYFPQLQWLQIDNNQFTGTIPISLSNFSKVEFIDMSLNNFTGKFRFDGTNTPNLSWLSLFGANVGTGGADDLSFLDTLVNCSGLDVLQMGDNVFGGLLPNSIANLSTTVRVLDFSYNLISGSIPVGLSNILNLQFLALNYNQFTGTLPEDIGKIQGLQQANFSNNKLNGRIPSSFGNLSWLTDLDLSFNKLEGNIPTNLGDCKSLLSLDLRRNDLDGNIPPQLFQASSLVKLYLQHNHLQGSLPSQISELKNLQVLDISNNNMSGTIPSSVSQCVGITNMCLQGNSFDGSIPPSFTLLTSLQLVDLSCDRLSGEIPNYFSNISSLVFLNLSYNNLEGEVPTKGVFTNVSGVSLVGNAKLCGGIPELNLPRCKTFGHSKGRKLHSPAIIVIITISCVFVGLAMVSTFYLIWSRRRKASSSRVPSLREPFLRASYDMLLKATDGFSMTNLIGAGGFGSVYRGTLLLQDGVEKDVAIKVIDIEKRGASKSFMAECEALRTIRHRNLVGIITACSSIDFQGNDFKALVYEFMSNGSLDKWLYQLQSLSLVQRVNIAMDVAYALDYIHNEYGTPIIHCDLKPNNVLLDETMTAHVGDFGLAKLIPEISQQLHNNSSVGVRGTVGYAAPEYGLGTAVSAAGDMYSYGIMLIEMMTAKRPTDPMFEGDLNLHKFAKLAYPDRLMEILDPSLNLDDHDGEENNHSNRYDGREVHHNAIECIKCVINVGVSCSSELPRDRMDIKDVITQLQSARNQIQPIVQRVLRPHTGV